MPKVNLRRFLIAFLIVISALPYATAQEIKEPIVVNGDKVEYLQDKKVVVASKNIEVTYKDVVMTCDKITVYLDTKDAVAEGDVKITQKDAYFTGDKVTYNFEKRTGHVENGYINSKPFYGKSREMDKVSDKQVNMRRGYVTTCDLEKPHYRVQAHQVRIYLEDKIIAKHVLFFIRDIPVLYLPYYVQPLKERTAHITVMMGDDKDWGYYALTSLRYYFSEIAKGRFLIDYRQKKGIAEGIDDYYSTKELGSGSAKFYSMNENDVTTASPSGETEFRWRGQVRHRWDIDEENMLVAEYNQMSDKNFIKDYLYKEYEEEGEPDNYILVTTTKDDYTANFLIRKRMDPFFTVVERLPEFKIDMKNYRIGDLPVYYKGDASGVYLNKTYEKLNPLQKDVNTVRVDSYNQLSYVSKIGFMSVTPYAGTEHTYYSRNMWGDTNLVRGVFKAGVNNSTKFYRIYDVESNILGLDIHHLRHIVTPTANYYYTHQPTISPSNLNQFDSVDAVDTENGVVLALENKLQTKRDTEKDGAMKSVDLATLIVSSDYMFRLDKDYGYKSQKFKTVDLQFELSPYPGVFILTRTSINTKNQSVETTSVDLTASHGEDWSIGFGHRYESVESGKSNLITYDASYRISPKWRARAYGRYDIFKKAFEEQEYTVYRDLHCWLAEVTYNIKAETGNRTIWMALRLKAFPDTPIGFRRTYSRAQPGATAQTQQPIFR